MFKEPWFRFLAWSTVLFFFFVSFMTLACIFGPPPHQGLIHLWMSGMMKAMMQSLMGIAMHSSDHGLTAIQYYSVKLLPPLALAGLIFGLYLRVRS